MDDRRQTSNLRSHGRNDVRRAALLALALSANLTTQTEISGIYPHLAMFNGQGECGTGAVVAFAERLWVISYAPHEPRGSDDSLYEITPDLRQIIRTESVGGTPANRMVHAETNQLVIGPYVIDAERRVRSIPPDRMPGRLTGVARHLTEPDRKVYVATMEEGLYEVDLRTLEVFELYADSQRDADPGRPANDRAASSNLPGYHGKGLYSGQGVVVYANNGENSAEARARPDVPSGCLAEWDGAAWRVVRRNQFTEVSGPGGIRGNASPTTDPIWSIGWDHRSLILMLRDRGEWCAYRLPKGSHSYDGAHGWNTEWPRIRDVEDPSGDLLMTMHGTFWRFPRGFTASSSAGIVPRSNYLKVVGDFCAWRDRVVFGCDDTARNEFLNRRRAKGDLAGPGQSNSNLWFVEPAMLDALGPAIGRGAVWITEHVPANTPSDPFLFDGYDARGVHLAHGSDHAVRFTFEVDAAGDGSFRELREVEVPSRGSTWIAFDPDQRGAWVRIRTDTDAHSATAAFAFANADHRGTRSDPIFDGLATVDDRGISGALLRVRGDDRGTLAVCASNGGYYELDAELTLRRVDDDATRERIGSSVALGAPAIASDAASVLYIDDDGGRWRLPKGDPAFDRDGPLGPSRLDREVVTERDLFSAQGTFYELPARNAGGFAKLRPIATHRFRIHDFCSFRGMIVMSGLAEHAEARHHVVRSDDGEVALWLGAVDDLWRLGKPRGVGGPWCDSPVVAGAPSDPYLMTGYDRKSLSLSHDADSAVHIDVQVDVTGTGIWCWWRTVEVPAGEVVEDAFPPGFRAYWVRTVADRACRATATFRYD